MPVSHGVERLVAFANRDRNFLFAAAATDAELHGLIGRNFRNQAIEFAHAGYTIALKPDDDVVFSSPAFSAGLSLITWVIPTPRASRIP